MRAAKKAAHNIKILQDFVPLNALSNQRFGEITEKVVIEVVKSGRYLFHKGDRDNRTIYLLEGKVELIGADRKLTGVIEAGTEASRHPVVNQQPRPVAARAVNKAVIAWVDSRVLDAYLTWDQFNTAEVVELEADDTGDWMSRLLKIDTFSNLPPSKLQGLLMRMKPFPVEQGDVVIAQGEEGDYFYTIHEGRCQVTCREEDGSERVLAELSGGDSFGEEALVSDVRRNATITMLTNGQLMRLAKQDFDALLKTQLLRYIDYPTAAKMVDEDAVWLDVRTPDEYAEGAFEDSVNLPLATLRNEMPELVFNTSYVICCDTGQRSDSAGFVLSHKGFDVYVLKGGISSRLSAVDGQKEDTVETSGGPVDLPDQAERASEVLADDGMTALREQHTTLQQQNVSLVRELSTERKTVAQMSSQVEQLRGELGNSAEQLGELKKHLDGQGKEKQTLEDRIRALQQEQQARLDGVQQTLVAEQDKNAVLKQQAAAESARREAQSGKTEKDLQELIAVRQQLEGELTAARGRVAALEGEVQNTAAEKSSSQQEIDTAVEALREENSRLSAQVASLEATNTGLKSDLDAASMAGEDRQHERDGQLESLGQELATAQDRIKALQEESQRLHESQQAAEERLHEETEHDAALDTMRRELTAEQQTSAELSLKLKQVEDARAAALAQSAEQSDTQLAEATAQQQALSDQLAALQASQGELEATHRQIAEERDALRQQLDAERDSRERQVEELTTTANERLARQQAELESEQQRSQAAESRISKKDQQVAALERAAAADAETRQLLDDEAGQIRQQLVDAQELLQQRETHARELETEYAESLSKSHEELTRKNDTEKELQGQIDRLRKKLEQVSQDGQKNRESSLDDLDNLREELHNERQARAEERAQMAARQRELKEQLAAIATQHEANMTDQSGAIEQARDAAREEERSHMQSLMDSHAETEERLVRVQAELQQAYEEIAVLDQQEKARRQAEIDAIQEQNEQAEAAITQLENQLKQLTNERDAALEEQHELRVKMNTLRGEVEVARGLMTAGGKGRLEDPGQLRAELEETRNNVQIAVRLRAEAEAARDRMAAEIQRLGASSAGDQDTGEPLHVPSLDAFDPHAEPSMTLETRSPLIPESAVMAARTMGMQDSSPGRKRPVLRIIAGLLLVGVVGLAAWLMRGGETPQFARQDGATQVPNEVVSAESTLQSQDTGRSARKPAMPADRAGQPSTPPDVVIKEPAATSAAEFPRGEAVPPLSGTSKVLEWPVTPGPGRPDANFQQEFVDSQPLRGSPLVDPVMPSLPGTTVASPSVPSGPPPVGRSFRDTLKGGGKGPAMIELLPATFQMGSIGNSLNFDEGPRHTVWLKAFTISKREITFAEYDRFARATGRRLPYDETWGRGKRPAINVSWHDAQAYTRWLSKETGYEYRLPSEAEWEYAARAGSNYSYWWTDTQSDIHANCFDCGSRWDGQQTAPVGSFQANRFGLYDMTGNVQEWTADCYHNSYTGAPDDGSAWAGPDCAQRVVRGGAYSSPLDTLRSAKRGQLNQDTRLDNLGFRVVRVE
jgi:formylglycine-generating enzyme required for sulfatase activity/CRP-like cAMP-binding protein